MPYDCALPKYKPFFTIDTRKREGRLDDRHRGAHQIVAILGDAPGRRNYSSTT